MNENARAGMNCTLLRWMKCVLSSGMRHDHLYLTYDTVLLVWWNTSNKLVSVSTYTYEETDTYTSYKYMRNCRFANFRLRSICLFAFFFLLQFLFCSESQIIIINTTSCKGIPLIVKNKVLVEVHLSGAITVTSRKRGPWETSGTWVAPLQGGL